MENKCLKELEIVEKTIDDLYKNNTILPDLYGSLKRNIEVIKKEFNNQEELINVFKNSLTIEETPTEVVVDDHSIDVFPYFLHNMIKIHQNVVQEGMKEALRDWVLKNAFPKEMEVLNMLMTHFQFAYAIRYGNNQPMLRIENKSTCEYWELPICKEDYDLMKWWYEHEKQTSR